MSLMQAIDKRRAQRNFTPEKLEQSVVDTLKASIEKYNGEQDMNIQLVLGNGDAFKGLSKTYGMFSGVHSYICMIANKKDKYFREKIGYYGEKLMLEAVSLGLGTCWVGLTYDDKKCPVQLREGDILVCTIPLGYTPEKQKTMAKFMESGVTKGKKPAEQLFEADTAALPQWFKDGAVAVSKAPSAKNKQPVKLHYKGGNVTATVAPNGGYEQIDLGIAKLHFELGAGGGNWQLGDGGEFLHNA